MVGVKHNEVKDMEQDGVVGIKQEEVVSMSQVHGVGWCI